MGFEDNGALMGLWIFSFVEISAFFGPSAKTNFKELTIFEAPRLPSCQFRKVLSVPTASVGL